MPPFNTQITGRDIPANSQEWEDLTADELCVIVNRQGMLTSTDGVRAAYIRNHIRMVEVNHEIQRQATQHNVYVSGDAHITTEHRIDNFRTALLAELSKRGVPAPSGGAPPLYPCPGGR